MNNQWSELWAHFSLHTYMSSIRLDVDAQSKQQEETRNINVSLHTFGKVSFGWMYNFLTAKNSWVAKCYSNSVYSSLHFLAKRLRMGLLYTLYAVAYCDSHDVLNGHCHYICVGGNSPNYFRGEAYSLPRLKVDQTIARLPGRKLQDYPHCYYYTCCFCLHRITQFTQVCKKVELESLESQALAFW